MGGKVEMGGEKGWNGGEGGEKWGVGLKRS